MLPQQNRRHARSDDEKNAQTVHEVFLYPVWVQESSQKNGNGQLGSSEGYNAWHERDAAPSCSIGGFLRSYVVWMAAAASFDADFYESCVDDV